MKNFIEKIANDFNIEIIESDMNNIGINTYKTDTNGNVIHLYLNQVPINEIEIILPLADYLIVLSLFECNIRRIDKIKYFKKLEELDLTLNSITQLKGLERLTNLKKLILSCVYMDSIDELQYLKGLEILDLSSNIDFYFNKGLEQLELKELNLEGNDILQIENINSIKSLVKLNLKGCEISEIVELERFPNLEELNLSCNPIKEIKGLKNLVKLKELRLYSTKISKIEGLDFLVNLELLDLSCTQISKIQGLNKLINIRDLNLSYINIKNIIGLENLKKMELLMLINTGVSVIENIPFDSLKILDLSKNQIKSINPKMILLEEVYLDGNQITYIDYDWLKNIKQKCFINLTNNPIKIVREKIPEHITIETEQSDGIPLIL